MTKLITSLLGALALSMLAGCATPTKMALQDDAERLTEKSKPVYLMTATLKNSYKASFQPRLMVVNVEKLGASQAADRLNFTMDDKAKNETDTVEQGNSYLLRMELDAGKYELRGLTSSSGIFPIRGFFFAPMHSPFEVSNSGVYYLGHVNATVRERKESEFKAGPSIPLLDQAVSGASTGTFDVEIIDAFASDEAAFRAKFPALKDVKIQKAILPAFDRAKAQKWWEAN